MITAHTLRFRPPFDLTRTLAFVRGFSPMHGEQVVEGPRLTKAMALGGHAIGYQLEPIGDRDAAQSTVAVHLHGAPEVSHDLREAALARIAATLGADDDLDAFYASAAKDVAFAPLTVRYHGLRHVRFPSAFEAACWAVINQRTSQDLARRWKEALTRRAGLRIVLGGHEHWAFPEPAAVARLELDELARLVPGGRRARAIAALAAAFVEVSPSFLREAPVPEVRDWLRAIHGVGPFTSSFILYRGLGRFDALPPLQPRFVAAASVLYGRSLGPGDVLSLAGAHGAWAGYWMLYLWASTFVPPVVRPVPAGAQSETRSRSGRPSASARPESSR